MSDPVTLAEASLLARDQDRQPWQQALVLVISGGLTRQELQDRIGERIGYAPRFRRVVTGWPLPVWADDANFNLAGHVREVSLASGERLQDWLATELTQPLPRSHPLWAVRLVNLAPGSQVVVARVHPALVDGYDHVHLFQELLDDQPDEIGASSAEDWQPGPGDPTDLGALAAAGLADPVGFARRAAAGVCGLVASGVRAVASPQYELHLGGAEVDLATVAELRGRFGCTTHDVLVCLATAGVRRWQAENARPLSDVLALVPLAVTEPDVLDSAIGCRIAPSYQWLPVTAGTAVERLEAIASLSRARLDSGVSVRAKDLIELPGFAPATMLAVAAGSVGAGRPHSVQILNVPGSATSRYLGRARLRQVYAATSLSDGQELSIAITSYRGRITITATANAAVDSWAEAIAAELAALKDAR